MENNGFAVVNLFDATKDSFAAVNPRLVFLDLSFVVAKNSFVVANLFTAVKRML